MTGITVKVEGVDEIIGVPYEFITPLFENKTTILLLHRFNSGPGNNERRYNLFSEQPIFVSDKFKNGRN